VQFREFFEASFSNNARQLAPTVCSGVPLAGARGSEALRSARDMRGSEAVHIEPAKPVVKKPILKTSLVAAGDTPPAISASTPAEFLSSSGFSSGR
jgi:hypothetical protein